MADESQPPMGDRDTREQGLALTVYQLAVIAPVLVGLTAWAIRYRFDFDDPALFFWAMAIALVDLMPVPAWGGLQLSLAFPIRFAVALIYAPPLAAIDCSTSDT